MQIKNHNNDLDFRLDFFRTDHDPPQKNCFIYIRVFRKLFEI